MNSDAEEDFNINNEGEYSCSEEWDENIENIASIINTHGNSYIPGSEAVENVASLQSPDILECDDFVNVVNVEAPKKKSKKTKEPKIKWQKKDLKPTLYEYKNEKSGVQLELSQSPSPLDIFECFFTNDFVEKIIFETNRQYIPSKRHRFGIKFFVLADCETGFILDFIVYTGSETEFRVHDPELKIGGNIVMTLMEPYLNEGHILYVDNWYNSPVLAEALFEKKTNICGTVKTNRLHANFPKKDDTRRRAMLLKQFTSCFTMARQTGSNYADVMSQWT
ncbi:hypothetical protein JTB14_021004 [Gonioctena quinquepunctata]|nr:hypothetical protein JTB14_021004 [Gonioctena quinquepunctata]